MRYIILLWGEKSSLIREVEKEVPVFTFMEVIHLGRESRKALFGSHDARMSPESLSTNSDYYMIALVLDHLSIKCIIEDIRNSWASSS